MPVRLRRLLVALIWWSTTSAGILSAAEPQIITGDPLRITAFDDLQVQVHRKESGVYNRQYFGTYRPYLILATSEVAPFNADFAPVSNVQSDASTIVTTVSTGDQLSIVQTITYSEGDQAYAHRWTIVNNGQTTYTGVSWRYGGDTFFANSDQASGFYDASLGMVYCTNPGAAGLMGMFGGSDTPADHFYEGGYSDVVVALANPHAHLPDAVDKEFIDNGMGLEWELGQVHSAYVSS